MAFLSYFIFLLSISTLYSLEPMIYNSETWIEAPKSSYAFANYSMPPISSTWKSDETEIFIGISSFRDRRCGLTIKNLITKAKNPQRLYFGIVEAKHTEEDKMDCITDYCKLMSDDGLLGSSCPYEDHIRYIEHSWLDARGPGHSRSMIVDLLEDEEFCMQVDSHTDTVKHWDVKTLSMWGSINNEYGILSTRLPDISSLPTDNKDFIANEVPHLCQATYTSSGMIRNLQPRVARDLKQPLLAPFWSAGFSFSKCHAERKVPYDPLLPFIFDGEEFTRFARYWTRGYDIYSPNEIIFGHDYVSKMISSLPEHMGEPRKENGDTYEIDRNEWARNGMNAQFRRRIFDDAVLRANMMIKGPDMMTSNDIHAYAEMIGTLSKYGLGMKRTLDQLIEFTGIDVRSNRVYGDRCVGLKWVPFHPDRDPYTEDDDMWGGAPEILYQGSRDIPLTRSDITIIPYLQHAKIISANDILSSLSSNLRTANPQLINDESSASSWLSWNAIDMMIRYIITSVDQQAGAGRGQQVLKVILLGSPIVLGVVAGAMWVMRGDERDAISYAKSI